MSTNEILFVGIEPSHIIPSDIVVSTDPSSKDTNEMTANYARWGLYPWFEEHGTDLIHPDDLAAVRRLMPSGKVFRVMREDEGFIRLSYGEIEFRARPSLFKEVASEVRGIGEAITLKDGRTGVVMGIQWHHKRGEPMYQLRLEGKKKSNRYWNSDFATS